MISKGLYIVDNSTEAQSVKKYLQDWCEISKQIDIATGYLEIGSFLELDLYWQKVDKIRIILGNEVSKRTKDVFDHLVEYLLSGIKNSIDQEQESNDFLIGVPAVLEAMKKGQIECKVYDKSKFHAKAYITYLRDEYLESLPNQLNIPDGYALVGSSNFTKAGLTKNIELNIQHNENVDQLQNWFEAHWKEGQDITEAMLKVIEQCHAVKEKESYCKCAELWSPEDFFLGRHINRAISLSDPKF